MKLITILFFLVISLFAQSGQKEILLLHSYHKGYKWTDDISKAIEDSFKKDKSVEVTTIYMDTKKIYTKEYLKSLLDLYKIEFKDRKFDLIIASDNNALAFLKDNSHEIFQDIPIVFCGINYFEDDLIDKDGFRQRVTGVVEEVDVKTNIDLILQTLPRHNKLLIINDKSPTGLRMREAIFKELINFTHLNYEYIDKFEIDFLKNAVKNLQKNDVILFVLLHKDVTGKYFTYQSSLDEIKSVSDVPIFGLWDFYIGGGIVGGYVTNGYSQGFESAKIAKQLLAGKDIKQINMITKSPNRYMLDYDEIKKFDLNIHEDVLKYATVINKPFSFYETYKKLVWLAISVMVFFISLIILLITNIQKRNRAEKSLVEQIKFLEVLIETIPNPIWYKDKDGKYLGCNKAYARFLGSSKSEIVGKTSYAFFDQYTASIHSKIDEDILDSLKPDIIETTLYKEDGTSKQVIVNKAPFYELDGSLGGIVCIIDDITEANLQKQFLIQQSKLAEMGDMVAAIAHQWNEPLVELSAIVQDVQMQYLNEHLSKNDIDEFVQDSMKQIQYMSKTLKDFRNFLKPSVKKVDFDALKAFQEIFEIIEKQILYSNIKIVMNVKESERYCIYGYENEFKQVLLNIINNAKQKVLSKKIKKEYIISIDIDAYEDLTHIRISDDAGGISKDIKDKIFDPYFTTNKDGTGLGLYMAKVIIEDKMKGTIKVTSKDINTTFHIFVPKGVDCENITT
jgi:PAS domain S-box-containing protein